MINFLIKAKAEFSGFLTDLTFTHGEAIAALSNDPHPLHLILLTSSTLVGFILAGATFLIKNSFWLCKFIRAISKGSIYALLGLLMIFLVGILVAIFYDTNHLLIKDVNWYLKTYLVIWDKSKPVAASSTVVLVLTYFWVKKAIEPSVDRMISTFGGQVVKAYEFPTPHNIHKFTPKRVSYDPREYFAEAAAKNSFFLGLDQRRNPILIEEKRFQRSVVGLMGAPGMGKNVMALNLCWQALLRGHSVIVFNPKIDEYTASVLHAACKEQNKRLVRLNLKQDLPCENPLADISEGHLYEVLVNALGLTRTGSDADYYRALGRTAARALAKTVLKRDNVSFRTLYQDCFEILGESVKEVRGLVSQLEELSYVRSVDTFEGGSLQEAINNGGCVLIEGDTMDESVITMTKIFLIRFIQIVRDRGHDKLQSLLFCDELKYLNNKTLVDAVGTLRDKNVNVLYAHQSRADLGISDSHLESSLIQTTFTEVTSINWTYCCTNYETAMWVAQNAGTDAGYRETIETYINEAATEIKHTNMSYRQDQFPYIHPNLIMQLPQFCAVLTGVGIKAEIGFADVIKVPKVDVPYKLAATRTDSMDDGGDLL